MSTICDFLFSTADILCQRNHILLNAPSLVIVISPHGLPLLYGEAIMKLDTTTLKVFAGGGFYVL
jgi:hypothetical protein